VADWLQETDATTVFEGYVVQLVEPWTASLAGRDSSVEYDAQRGGWNFDPGPDTWPSGQVLARFEGRLKRRGHSA
jgi:hypothetical protein